MTRPAALLGLTGLRIDGGIASVSRCIARALDEEVAAGRLERVDRVLLLEDPARPAPPPLRGTQRLARGSQPRFVGQLWRLLLRHRHDLLLFDLVGLARSVTLPLPGAPHPRFAVFVHGIELETARSGWRGRALARADRVLTNSTYTGERVRASFPDLSSRVRVVPLCIDPERSEAWERAGLGAGEGQRRPAALIVGRMWSEERGKGHDELIDAWPAVRRAVPGAELWVVGTGDDVPRLEARVREAGLAEAVRFLGRVPDPELADLYARASVFAMPSRQEGFGLVYAEAMWFGLPCLGSTADAAAEVIVDGETGRLVPYGNPQAVAAALVDLLRHPEERRRLGAAARLRARQQFGYPRFRSDLLRALSLDGASA